MSIRTRTRRSLPDRVRPRLLFPLYEGITGRRYWSELQRLRKLQWHSAEELERRALHKLRPLLAHATAQVPFYRDLFGQAGISPGEIKSIGDLSHVPITTKAELRASFPLRTVAENLPPKRRFRTSTSGSTGLPFEFFLDRTATDSRLGSYLFFWEWAGAKPGAVRMHFVLSLRPSAAVPAPSRWAKAARRLVLGEQIEALNGLELSGAEFRARVAELPEHWSYLVWGIPSAIARLAGELLEAGQPLARYPTAVIATGETLNPLDTATIEAAMQCRITNHYSTYEVLHLAQSCPNHPALLHVNSERAIVRVVRADGSTAVAGETGRVVVTDLWNWVMPFVNYDLGDWAIAGATCPCGRGFPTLQAIEGRLGEVICTPAGKSISPVALGWFLTHVQDALPYIWEYQAVQTAADALTLRIVPTSHFTVEKARELEMALGSFLGPGIRTQVEAVERIEREGSGKRLTVKSALTQA
jgi:phenylacetate-CoA ligase